MEKLFSNITLLLLSVTAIAQVQTHVIGDSIYLHGNGKNSELILQNSTQNVPGFLYNKGNGRTEFRRVYTKLNDTLFLIGGDTLHLNTNSLNNGNNIFYVSRKFKGFAKAVINGTRLNSITSSNPEYISQLGIARPGSLQFTYPDPFSARNAALDAIALGTIINAQIVVLDGNSYTIGFADSTKNGSVDGLFPNNGTVADIQFVSTTLASDNSISSFLKNKVDMYFGIGCNIKYINSSSNIYCFYNTDTAYLKSGVYGQGSFYQVYGEVNGFIATFGLVKSPNSYTDFHAHEIVIQQWQGFNYQNFLIANVSIDNLFSTDACTFFIGGGITKDGSPGTLNVRIKNCRFGKGETPYPDSDDWWYFIIANTNSTERVTVLMDIDNMYLKSGDFSPLFYVSSGIPLNNLCLNMNIGNLVQRDSHIRYSNGFGIIGWYYWGASVNNTLTFNIQSADIDAPLLGSVNTSYPGSKNNQLNINVGYLQKNASAFNNGVINMTNIVPMTGEPMSIKVNGYFKSFDSGALIFTKNNYPDGYCLPIINHYQFTGRYETVIKGQPVIHLYHNTGKIIGLTDVLLINDSTNNSMIADSPGTPIYIKNVHSTGTIDRNVLTVGDAIKVIPDILSYIQ